MTAKAKSGGSGSREQRGTAKAQPQRRSGGPYSVPGTDRASFLPRGIDKTNKHDTDSERSQGEKVIRERDRNQIFKNFLNFEFLF